MSEFVASVVMPLFNKETQVLRSLRSILAQTPDAFELIVVNDGSTDASRRVVSSISDRRVRLIDQENAGVSAARNRGIREARADLIVFCDADDEWQGGHLADIADLKSGFPGADVYATGYLVADGERRLRTNILRGLPAGFEQGRIDDYFALASVSEPPLTASSIGATRQSLEAVGLFPEGVGTGEDLLTWARLAERFQIAYRRRPSAIFWQPASIADRPGRVPALPDVVGRELALMLARARGGRSAGLAAYLALWHRMRGVIYLKLGDRRRAREELGRSLRIGGRRPTTAALWLLCLLPEAGKALEVLERRRHRARGARP